MKNTAKWLWISRILMVAAAVGIIATSCFLYDPNNFPLGHISAQLGQIAVYGGLATAVTAFAWFWPEAGGIIAVFVGLFYIWRFESIRAVGDVYLVRTPVPVFYILQGLFIGSGALGLIAGLNRKQVPYTPSASVKKLRRTASGIAYATIIVFVITYIFIYPPLIFFAIPSIVIVTIAWGWPAPGAILMLLISVPSFYPLVNVGWEISWKWPIYVLLAVFIVSALMYLVLAWKIRRLRMVGTSS